MCRAAAIFWLVNDWWSSISSIKMPVSCAASGCKSRYTLEARERGITFHRFPRSNPALLDKWCRAMRRATSTGELWMPSRYQRLCSLHFQQSCFDTTGQTKRLRDDVIPSIFNFPEDPKNTAVPESKVVDVTLKSTKDILIMFETQRKEPQEDLKPTNVDSNVQFQVQLQDHPYFIPDIETLKKKLQASEDSRAQKEKELRNAKDREKRLRQTCLSICRELSKRNLLSSDLQETLRPFEDIPLKLFKKPELEYSAKQRLFSLILQLHDPLSYRYLRKEIKLPLPAPRRLRQWLKSDCKGPGLNSLVLEALLQKKQAEPQLYTRICIVLGSRTIQQNVTFDHQRNEFVGFVNLGAWGTGGGSQEVASELLMFMLVGTVGYWRAPIGCFFVRSLTPQVQKQLLLHILHELSENSFEVVALSMERHVRNQEMCSLLGCKFTDAWQLQTHFSLPNSDSKHYIVFDMAHELQVVADTIEELGAIQSPDGTITWQYITDLMNLRRPAGLLPQLMKMPLLVNKISDTVANALKLVQHLKHEEFAGSQATVNFIQIIGRLFDIFNSSCPWIEGDKGPITYTNIGQMLQLLQETREYLLTLITCVNDNYLFRTSSAQSVLGLLVNITSLSELLPHLLMDQDCVTTHRFSIQHLKEFFHSIKNTGEMDGCPTVLDVQHALEELLSQCGFEDTCLKDGISFEDKGRGQSLFDYVKEIPSPFEETSIELPDHFYSSRLLDVTIHNSAMYIAGWVVRKAVSQLSCNKCRWALISGDHPRDFTSAYHLLHVRGSNALFLPSEGTVKTVHTAERELLGLLNSGSYMCSMSAVLEHHVLLTLGSKDIFYLKKHIQQTELCINNHYFQLLRLITSLYYTLKKPYIEKISQANQCQARVKQTLTRDVVL